MFFPSWLLLLACCSMHLLVCFCVYIAVRLCCVVHRSHTHSDVIVAFTYKWFYVLVWLLLYSFHLNYIRSFLETIYLQNLWRVKFHCIISICLLCKKYSSALYVIVRLLVSVCECFVDLGLDDVLQLCIKLHPDILNKTEYEIIFLRWIILSKFLTKTLKINKIAMKLFSKICRLELTLNCRLCHYWTELTPPSIQSRHEISTFNPTVRIIIIIIDNYNSSVRIIDLVSHTTYVCV